MDRGTWWATVRGVSKSQTQMSDKQGEVQIVNYWGGSWGLEEENTHVYSLLFAVVYILTMVTFKLPRLVSPVELGKDA